MPDPVPVIATALAQRFGEAFEIDPKLAGLDELARMAARRVRRRYLPQDVPPELLRLRLLPAMSFAKVARR